VRVALAGLVLVTLAAAVIGGAATHAGASAAAIATATDASLDDREDGSLPLAAPPPHALAAVHVPAARRLAAEPATSPSPDTLSLPARRTRAPPHG
jgi:hypothetical protein